MIRSGMLVLSAVAILGVAGCDRTEKVGATNTTSATPSAPAEATPAPIDPSVAPGTTPATAEPATPAPKPGQMTSTGGHVQPIGARDAGAAMPQMQRQGMSNHGSGLGTPGQMPQPSQPGNVDNNVGPGHITTPALPDDHRATGAPNSDGSHNIGTAH